MAACTARSPGCAGQTSISTTGSSHHQPAHQCRPPDHRRTAQIGGQSLHHCPGPAHRSRAPEPSKPPTRPLLAHLTHMANLRLRVHPPRRPAIPPELLHETPGIPDRPVRPATGAASLAHTAGADLKTVQDQLGHASIVVTADTYTSVLPAAQHKAAEATARLILTTARNARAKMTAKIKRRRAGPPPQPTRASTTPPRASTSAIAKTAGQEAATARHESQIRPKRSKRPARVQVPQRTAACRRTADQTSGPPGTRTRNLRIKSPQLFH
ncbi:integrase family protein [Actinoplanes sp. SE50]|nr:integrase family protein [Actinoplanes sp. SE50/110]ATO79644.1 integrase family protein [Actinoplanes sp. SE50]SLL97047.1 Site-specific recombinase XerD [Actinoplanes sp. SE50/110]